VQNESLRERKKKQTRKRICEVSSRLFSDKGYASTTVDEIALEAEISKPTFFNYFPSKVAVLHALLEAIDEQFVNYISDELKQQATTEYRLSHLMTRSANYINRQPELTRMILVEGLGGIGNVDQSRSRFTQLHEAMEMIMAAGVKQGDVRRDYPPQLLVQTIVGAYLYALLNWLSNQDYDLKEQLQDTANFLANAIKPETV